MLLILKCSLLCEVTCYCLLQVFVRRYLLFTHKATKTESEQKDPVLFVQLSLQKHSAFVPGRVCSSDSLLDAWVSGLLWALWNILSNVTHLSSYCQASALLINIQSTLLTAPNLCKMFHSIIFGSNGDSCTVSTQSDVCVCIYTHILHNMETLVRQKK